MKHARKLIARVAFTMLLFTVAVMAQAQGIAVKGHISDSSGEGIIGATVVVKGQPKTATVSDFDGNFSLTVPNEKSVLVVSYVGMKSQEVIVGKKRNIEVSLEDDSNLLEEAVVVGYGQQKKASVVGAITQTTGEVLERAGGVTDLGSALTGNLPGVITESSTGMPGSEDPRIVIRGVSSWNNSQPLILVDGIEREMSSVDISSVQSISVLKDASATAVYGVKGANGVILITTKRGNEGRARIEAGANVTAKVVSKLPSKLGSADALAFRNTALEHELALRPENWGYVSPSQFIDNYRTDWGDQTDEYGNLLNERYANTDWQKALFKDMAISYNGHVTVMGGTKHVRYFSAVDFTHEADLFREYDNHRGYQAGYGYNRINGRANLDFQITNTTVLKANIAGSYGAKKRPMGQYAGFYGENEWQSTQLWQSAYSAPSDVFVPVYSDGYWGFYMPDSQAAPNSVQNIAISGINMETNTRINTDFTLEQDLKFITKGLSARATISWDNNFTEQGRGIQDSYNATLSKYIDPITGVVSTPSGQKGDAYNGFDPVEEVKWSIESGSVVNWGTRRNLFYQAQLNYARQFGKHDVTAMGVFNRTENTTGSNFTNYREDWAFRTTYAYAMRYFFEYNGAYNGSEKFSKDNRFAFFNSGAIGWMVSEEKFFKPIKKYVDMLKIRYSYGEIGDDGGNWSEDDRWAYATQWAYGGNATNMDVNNGGSPYTFYKEKKVGNPDLHWERAVKRNLGIDYSFLGGMFAGSLEFFNENRKDIILKSRSVPMYFAGAAPQANVGRTKTTGYELELRFNKVFANGMRVWANTNMTHAKNVILETEEPALTPAYQKQTGYAIGQAKTHLNNGYANTWDDVIAMPNHDTNDDQKLPGQLITLDFNGDGKIDSNDSAPYAFTGTPQNTFNATIGFEWKGFSCFVQFYGVTNVTRQVGFNSLNGSKNLNNVFDEGTFWTKYTTNADAPMPRWLSTPNYYRNAIEMYDGSYCRLKNAEVAYTWTGGWIKSLGLNSLKVYLNGNNLIAWTHMPDDRESNFAGTGLASQGAYPTVRRFNLGVKFSL